jgi:hypothetical protein
LQISQGEAVFSTASASASSTGNVLKMLFSPQSADILRGREPTYVKPTTPGAGFVTGAERRDIPARRQKNRN